MDLPDGWTAVVADGPGPFVTRARLRRPDGSIVSWRSRAHRNRPGRLAAWMSGLFAANEPVAARLDNVGTALGAICFFVGALLLVPEARHPSAQPATA